MTSRLTFAIAAIAIGIAPAHALAQSAARQLDEAALPQGLIELELPDLLEHYLEAHPPADAALAEAYGIAAARLRMAPADRAAQLRDMIDRRAALLAAHPDHPARGTWLTEQASDLCLELWPTGGTDAIVLCGYASPAQRATAERIAREVPSLLDAAAHAIDARIRAIEAQPGYRDDARLQMQRRRLARDERDRRLPFLRGIALTIDAVINADTDAAERASATFAPLRDVLDGVALDQVRLYDAVAQLHAGAAPTAAARARLVIEHDAAPPLFRLMAQLTHARATAVTDGVRAARNELDAIDVAPKQLFERLLVTDARARIERAHGGRADRAIVDAYLAMLEAAPASSRAVVRDLVLVRLAEVLDDASDVSDLPAIATIARAEALLRRGGDGDVSAARTLLETAMKRRLPTADAARVRFLLAQAHRAAGDEHAAINALLDLAETAPRSDEAARGIEQAAALARRAHEAAPGSAAMRRQLRRVLDVIDAHFADLESIDTWRYARGRLELNSDALDAAIEAFGTVAADSPIAADACFMRAHAWRRRAIEADRDLQGGAAHDARRSTLRALDALDLALDSGAAASRPDDRAAFLALSRVYRAEALLAIGDPQDAIDALDGIESMPGIDSAALALALETRIAARRVRGELDAARADLATFVRQSPDAALPVVETMLGAALDAHADAERNGDRRLTESIVTERVGPLVDLVRGAVTDDRSPVLALRLADGLRVTGRYGDALVAYDRLIAREGESLEALCGRAECLVAQGNRAQLAEAIGLFKRIAAAVEPGTPTWWLSQLRMLEILDAAGRGTDQIVPRIEQLRLRDASLGGPPYEAAFNQLIAR